MDKPTALPALDDSADTDDDQDQSSQDPRHQRRITLMQQLFAWSFNNKAVVTTPDFDSLVAELPQIDADIQLVAPERPLTDINKIDLAILRLIVFESKHHKTPFKVLIDEGVELAKTYGAENSAKFINGVLAKLLAQTPTESAETIEV